MTRARATGTGGSVRASLQRHRRIAAAGVVPLAVWVGKLVQLRHSVQASAAFWSEPRGEPGGLRYVALGDSAAQSIGASDPDLGYVGLLARRLHDSTGRPVQVVNLSTSGAQIRDVLDTQLPVLLTMTHQPDVVTVAIGGNDVRRYDRERFTADVDALTRALPAGAFIADAPYFMHGRWEHDAQQAADVLTDSARAHGLHPVPLHEALRAQGWDAMLTQFAADWFHPNDRGHRVWADAFWRVIEPTVTAIR